MDNNDDLGEYLKAEEARRLQAPLPIGEEVKPYKHIARLVKIFARKGIPFFLMYAKDKQVVVSTNIKNGQGIPESLKASIDKHYH
jgi:hypothetical protein